MRETANKKVFDFIKSFMPGWRGRKAYLNVSVNPKRLISMWDGGSKDEYIGIDLATRKLISLPISGWMSPKEDYIPKAGVVLIEHSTFSGKDAGCTLFVHPNDADKFK